MNKFVTPGLSEEMWHAMNVDENTIIADMEEEMARALHELDEEGEALRKAKDGQTVTQPPQHDYFPFNGAVIHEVDR